MAREFLIKEKLLISISLVLLIAIVLLLFFSSLSKSIPIKSSWYLHGIQNCEKIDKPGIEYSFLCDNDKVIDIYYSADGLIINDLYSAKEDINEEDAVDIANYFLDFLDNLNCNLNSIQFYNQTKWSPEMKRGEAPPDFAYFLHYGCSVFNLSVTVSKDKEFDKMGKVYGYFHIDKNKVRDFAESVLSYKSFYFEPATFKCNKYIIFEDRIDFTDCKYGVRAAIFSFRVVPERLLFKGGSTYVE